MRASAFCVHRTIHAHWALSYMSECPDQVGGCGSRVVKVAGLITNSSPVPLKTHRVRKRCTLNLSRAQTSSRWCGVVVRRGGRGASSSTSLDHGSKLRGPSLKALV
ncbi:uncharacterized protein TNCV_3051311 [Trichonephila clavipes]|nr:uncharacterized protein TNCV_3051311 [Trichonephila clavipes]